jgi:hypothetical protein
LASGDAGFPGSNRRPASADFRGLHKLKDAAAKRFATGVVLHDGEMSAGFGDGLYAVPIRALWKTTSVRNTTD